MENKNYNMYKGIDLSMFETPDSSYDRNAARNMNAAPEKKTAGHGRPKLEVVSRPKKSVSGVISEMRRNAIFDAKIIAIALVFITMFSALLYSRFKVDELDRQISDLNTEITAAQSETVRLNMKIDSVISLKNVEDYAQTKLGMVKMENHQIEYIDLSGEDRVVLSGEKTLNADSKSLLAKVMEYISK